MVFLEPGETIPLLMLILCSWQHSLDKSSLSWPHSAHSAVVRAQATRGTGSPADGTCRWPPGCSQLELGKYTSPGPMRSPNGKISCVDSLGTESSKRGPGEQRLGADQDACSRSHHDAECKWHLNKLPPQGLVLLKAQGARVWCAGRGLSHGRSQLSGI